jgi:glycosyltransferase involved in cell wall biosynthesis
MKRIDLQNYDILITSSGPSIMNYFGYKIKKRNPNIFWVADYRDLNQNNPSKSDKFNFRGKKMDKLAFKYADLITTVSYGAKEQNIENAKKMGFDIRNKSYVLYNGFSLENNSLELSSKEELKSLFVDKDKIYIVYTGTIYSLQKIEYFLKVLADSQQLKFIYAGNSHQLIDVYVQKFNLEDKVINLGFVKKEEAEYLQKKADILLLLKLIDGNKDKGIMTGKFYEYLTKNKKIMVIGDQDEEFNEICKNLKNVDILPYDKDIIAEYLNNLKKEDLKENYDPNIERFSWETLAKEFDDFISQKLKEWKSTT